MIKWPILGASAGLSLAALAFSAVASAGFASAQASRDGYIKDESIAISYAKIILSSVYGADDVNSELPLTAKLKSGVWTVSGTLKPGLKGGVAEIEISKKDGRIIEVSHGK